MIWLVDTLLVTGALILAVLMLRRPVMRWFGPGLAYALWLLPLLRLIVPPITLPQEIAPAETVTLLIAPATATVAAATPPGWDFAAWALPLWLGGALAFLAWRAWGYTAMRRRLLTGAIPVGETEGVRLIETASIPAPVAFGLFDKVIALPPGFMAQQDLARRDLALAHELEHHRGRDLVVNIAVQPLFALHWFNPLAWFGWRALRCDQEAACDARVLAGSGPDARAEYGRLIASFAGGPRLALAAPMACPVLGEKSIIHRLRSLTMTEPTPRRRLLGRALIGTAALALPLTASITYAQNEERAATTAAPEPQVQVRRHMIIIDNPEGTVIDPANPAADHPNLHTRVVERNGRTIILKTTEPLTDAEAEERIARAEASIPNIPDMPPPSGAAPGEHRQHRVVMVHADGPQADATWHAATPPDALPPGAPGERRVVMVRSHGETSDGTVHAMAVGDAVAACGEGSSERTVSSETNSDGQREVRTIRICNRGGGTPEQTLTALRAARERFATNTDFSEAIRSEVLADLDREIARLSATN